MTTPSQLFFSLGAVLLLGTGVAAQPETTLLDISQSGIGSNGFGTSWRGQDVVLGEDAWLTRIEFATGSATPNVDEIRLMTATPNAVTLRAETNLVKSNTAVEAVLSQPYLLRAGEGYTIWFHQSGSPRGTSGCDLTRVDPSWAAYHTNVDPTQAPGAGEPGYFWAYQYGTNVRLTGIDNLEITGNLVPGGTATFQLDAAPNDLFVVLFGLGTTDQPFPPFQGPLRLDPGFILPVTYSGSVGPSGTWTTSLPIPNQPGLSGALAWTQALYDATFMSGGTFSPLEQLRIQ